MKNFAKDGNSQRRGPACARNVGSRVSKLRKAVEGARRRGGGALTTQPDSGIAARGSALLLLLRPGPRGWQPGLPAHMPRRLRGQARRAGRRHAPRRQPGSRLGLLATPASHPTTGRRPGRRARIRPGGALRRARPLSALCPLPSACGRLPAFRGPAPCLTRRTLRRPAGLSRSAPRLGPESGPQKLTAAPQAQIRARRSWAGAPGPALTQFSSKPGLGAGRSLLAAARRLHSL